MDVAVDVKCKTLLNIIDCFDTFSRIKNFWNESIE